MVKGKIILASSIADVSDAIKRELEKISQKKALFIRTAAEAEEGAKWWLDKDRKALIDAGLEVKDYTLTDKSKEEVQKALRMIDVVCVGGGNTFYLLEKMRACAFEELIIEFMTDGKVYIGSSAGSIVAGPDIYPAYRIDEIKKAPNLTDYKGLTLVDFVIMPHWGSDYFRNLYLNERLAHVYDHPENKIILLADDQYVVTLDGWSQIKSI